MPALAQRLACSLYLAAYLLHLNEKLDRVAEPFRTGKVLVRQPVICFDHLNYYPDPEPGRGLMGTHPLAPSRCAAGISRYCSLAGRLQRCRLSVNIAEWCRRSLSQPNASRVPCTRNTNPRKSNRPAKVGRLNARGCIANASAISLPLRPDPALPTHSRYNADDFATSNAHKPCWRKREHNP